MGFKDFFANFFDNEDDYEADYYEQEPVESSDYAPSEDNTSETIAKPVQSSQTNFIFEQATKEQNKTMTNDATRNNVVNLNESRKNIATVEIFKPRIFAEAERISQSLLSSKSVVLNLAQMSDEDARRFVDYMTGVVYAINGDLQRVATDVFIAVPETVQIEGLYEEYSNTHGKASRERGNIWNREGESRE
ncbi:cell division protein SepF [Aerococcus urinaeequi]|uniref:Cell division protein SepF n=1 Tax=Aerococcus viridans TaxID=1377 RepID=A0A2N6UF45_9LACT|nr:MULTISPECIES: cell division protein SepF [Aerococcus]OFU51320.1 hypothetical protein HMPREF3116_04325 [Aerococcus sp. HMSC10H05]PMC80167.1 DUF552 domain-containing protein [Aerococcus viridans]